MFFSTLFTYLAFLCCARLRVHAAHRGISLAERVDAMEYILVEQDLPFTIPISPCNNFVDEVDSLPPSAPPNTGEQTSAEWVRLIFHDFITADVAAGTGGLDASIGFESERAENVGKHFINDTLTFLDVFVNAYVSLADMIVLGSIMSLRTCSGLNAPTELKVGRIDATKAGPSGVPQAFTDLTTTLATFEKAGFNQTEAITAVACGHSLGGVHHVNFPEIVDEDVVTVTNTDGVSTFDSTPDVFDNTIITEYLTGTGKCGGPLVIGNNVTTRSDLRLFQSDSNATMKSLLSPDDFHTKCGYIFQRMVDTVPAAVTLSEPVVPQKWKIMAYDYTLEPGGTLSISGTIRYFCALGLTCPAPPTLSYTFDTSNGPTGTFSTLPLPTVEGRVPGDTCRSFFSTEAPFFGNFSSYCFSNNITSSTTAIIVEDEYSYPLFPSIFVARSNSSVSETTTIVNDTSFVVNTTLKLTAVALTCIVKDAKKLDVVFYQKGPGPACQQSPSNIFNIECTGITESEGSLERLRSVGEYTIFAGSQTWVGGAGLQAVQVGFQEVWSKSIARLGLPSNTTTI